jgi:predicted glutamine amidotransferase
VCRLLGYVASRPITILDVLGPEGLEEFTALTAVHGDGWGMAWQQPSGGAVRAATSPASAVLDPAYEAVTRHVRGRAGLLHLRWATGGLPVSDANTHPFAEDGVAFAHNGHVAPIGALEGLLTAENRRKVRGDTDSERYFRFVLQCIERAGSEADGVAAAIGVLMEEFPEASLNALMLTTTDLHAVHVNSRAVPPTRALSRLLGPDGQVPARHGDEYFAMDYRITDDAVHVISSGIDPSGWTPVPEDTVVHIDLGTREIERLDVGRR